MATVRNLFECIHGPNDIVPRWKTLYEAEARKETDLLLNEVEEGPFCLLTLASCRSVVGIGLWETTD